MRPHTSIGALAWNSFLLYLGYSLRDHWQLIYQYSSEIDLAAAVVLTLLAIWFLYRHLKKT